MNRKIRKVLRLMIVVLGIGILLSVASRIAYHRSLAASIAEIGIKIANNGELASPEAAQEAMAKRSQVEDEPFDFHPEKYKSEAAIHSFAGSQIITFGKEAAADAIVLFLHGGAYVNEITNYHLDFCDRMARETGAYVVVPLYPLAPNHTFEETYALLDRLYPKLNGYGKPLTMMGDSSGGGLAIAYCEYLVQENRTQPEHLIVFSPWVDVTMSGEDYEEYEAVDPMLELPGTVEMGAAWAGETDPKDYRISPYYGKLEGLTETTIYVGTRELLYPDVMSFASRLKQAKVPVTLHVGEGMNHVYPIYPLVPESVAAAKEAFEIITGD